MLRTAAQGVAHVHEQGVVHCDIKPANIFITREGTGVIGDFDVSRNNESRATMLAAAVTKVTFTFRNFTRIYYSTRI